jgi:vacuolar-type H+-ATPase subunit I/STV1
MKRHADFLGVLYLAWGAIFTLVGLAGLALAGGALAIAQSGGPVTVSSEFAAGVTALTLGLVAVLALLFGFLHVWIGVVLGRYRPWARLLALGLAVINLVLFPFGTALAGYALWVLLKNEGRELYLPRPSQGL